MKRPLDDVRLQVPDDLPNAREDQLEHLRARPVRAFLALAHEYARGTQDLHLHVRRDVDGVQVYFGSVPQEAQRPLVGGRFLNSAVVRVGEPERGSATPCAPMTSWRCLSAF